MAETISSKDKKLIVIENFKFRKVNVLTNGKVRWRCTKKTCGAKIYTNFIDNSVLKEESDFRHNHIADPHLARQMLSNAVKRKAVEELAEKPAKILRAELQKKELMNVDLTIKDIDYIRHNMYVSRRSILPKVPKNNAEVFQILRTMDIKTNREEDFLQCADEESKIVIFTCYTNMHFLNCTNTWYMDGTFQYCTKFFLQLFTIHGYKNGHYVPLIFCLLPDKKFETYLKAFQLLENLFVSKNLKCNPDKIVIDFELSIHKAVKVMWSHTNIQGCRFHLGQAWYRKIQKLGLSSEFNNKSSNIGQYLKLFFGMPLLNPEEVGICFVEYLFEIAPIDSRVQSFNDYIVETYIDDDAPFPPRIWASQDNIFCRTTNACESFHSKFNNNFYSAHPNLHLFISHLLDFQTDVYIKINSANKYIKEMRTKMQEKENFVKTLRNNLDNKNITIEYFLRCVSCKFLPPCI